MLALAVAASATQADFVRAPGSPYATGDDPYSLTPGSFNGDALTDLAVVNGSSSTVSVLLQQTGSAGFTAAAGSPFAVGTGPSFAAAGDFNGDGREDLAVANFQSGNVSVMLRQANGTFAAEGAAIDTASRPGTIAAADFNGDGKTDLAVPSWDEAKVEVYLRNGGNTGFTLVGTAATTGGVHPRQVAVGDLDGTGGPDLAVTNVDSDSVAVLLNAGAGVLAPAPGSPIATGDAPYSVVVARLDDDDLADVAVTNSGVSNSVTVLRRTGAGTFSPLSGSPFAVGSGPIGLAAGDFRLSGRLDLVTADSSASTLTILENDGTTFSRQSPISTLPDSGPYGIATGLFNDGDQRVDIAFTRVTGGTDNVNVLLNHAAPDAATGDATALTQTSATLNATVNPRGEDTDAHFEYGTTPSYGSTAPAGGDIPVGTDATDHAISRQITGLAPSTEYHYRIVAASPGGTVAGADRAFTTPAADAPAPPVSTVGGPPEAHLVAPSQIAAGTPTTLSAEGSSPAGSLTYKFDLDGSGAYATDVKTANTVQTTFNQPGTVKVGLQVTDDQGRTDTVRRTVLVTSPPKYKFSFTPSDPDVGDTVRFTVRRVLDDPSSRGDTLVEPLGPGSLATMTFGDADQELQGRVGGLLVKGRAADADGDFTHRYTRAGRFRARITVNDGNGDVRGVDVTVPVGLDPVAYQPTIETPTLTVTQGSCVGFKNPTAYQLSDKDVGPVTTRDVNPKNQIIMVRPPKPADIVFGGDIVPKQELINPTTFASGVFSAGSPWGNIAGSNFDLAAVNFRPGRRATTRQVEPTVTTNGAQACEQQASMERAVAQASANKLYPPGGDKGWRPVSSCNGQILTSYEPQSKLAADLVTEETVTTRHTWLSINRWDFGDGTRSGPEAYLPSYRVFHAYDKPGTFNVRLSTTFPRKLGNQIGQWNDACKTRPMDARKEGDERFATRSAEVKLRVRARYDRIKSRGLWMTTSYEFVDTDIPGVYETDGSIYINTRHKSTAYDPKTGLYNNPDDVGNANGILVVTPTDGILKVVPDRGEIIGAANIAWGSSYARRMALGPMPLKVNGTPGLIIPPAGPGGTHDFGVFNDPPASLGTSSKAPPKGAPFHINWAHPVLREGGGGRLEINVATPPPIGADGGSSDQTLVREFRNAGRRAATRAGVFDNLDVEIPAVTLVPGVLSFDGGKLSHHPSANEDIDPPWKASGKLTIFKIGVDMSPDHAIEGCPVRGGLGFKENGELVKAGAIVTGLNIPIPSYPAPVVSLADPALEIRPPTDETPLDLFGCLTLQDYPSGKTFQVVGCVGFLSGGSGKSIATTTPIPFCPDQRGTERFALTDTNSVVDPNRPGRRILRGIVLRVGGTLKLGPSHFTIAHAYLEYRDSPFAVEARAHVDIDIVGDHVKVVGDIFGYIRGADDWGIGGEAKLKQDILCIPTIGCLEPGISLLVSSRGLGGCAEAYGFSLGASVDFRDGSLNPHIPGCDLEDLKSDLGIQIRGLPGYDSMLRSTGRQAVGGAQRGVVKMDGEAPYSLVVVRGTERSPVVEVRDPSGKLVLDDTGAPVQGLKPPREAPKPVDIAAETPAPAAAEQARQEAPQGIIHNDDATYHDADVDMRNTTLVLIRKPMKGEYTITAKEGSPAIEAISHADAIAAETAKAGVVSARNSAKRQKLLSLRAELAANAKMVITEEGRNLSRKLAEVAGQAAKGGGARAAAVRPISRAIRFTPAPGDREVRRIVGVISRDGVPQKRIVLARYKAPGAPRAGRVRRLRVARTTTKVVVRFRPARNAVHHVIRATLGGHVTERVVGKKARKVVLSTALARKGGKVTVRAIGPLSLPGPAATKRVKPVKFKRVRHFVL